jgi:hypothetical protein
LFELRAENLSVGAPVIYSGRRTVAHVGAMPGRPNALTSEGSRGLDNALLMGVGLAAPAGLNAFIPLLIVGLADRISDGFDLGRPYDFLSSTSGILIVLMLLTIEIVVDKIPNIDHFNDLVQSAVRPAAGAVLMMAAVNVDETVHPLVAMLLGLLIAGTVHWYKATQRPAITIQTRGVGNPFVSIIEDFIAIATALVAVLLPLVGAIGVILSGFALRNTYRWALTGIFSRN